MLRSEPTSRQRGWTITALLTETAKWRPLLSRLLSRPLLSPSTVSGDGRATTYTNATGDSYVIRPSNSAPGGQAMDYYPSNGNPQIKINLGGG